MNGLECSEIMYSDILIDNEKYRLDSDFFKKIYLSSYDIMKNTNHTIVEKEIEVLTDFHANGSYENIACNFKLLDDVDYAYMVRTVDLERKEYISDVKYVTKTTYDFLAKSKVYGGEILINKIGTPGKTYLMPNLNKPVSLGMNLFMLRCKDNGKILPQTMYLFFNSKIGKNIIERKINGTVPLSIDKVAIKSLYLPCLSKGLQDNLVDIVSVTEKLECQAKSIYSEAEQILLKALNMDNFVPSQQNTTIKSLSQFMHAGRLDAEYFQPQYDELLEILKSQMGSAKLDKITTLYSIVNIFKSVEPGSAEYCSSGIPFVRVSDVSKYGISSPSIYLDKMSWGNFGIHPKKDTILFSKDGSVGIAYKVDKNIECITSSALLHLTVRDTNVLPDYLTLVLNSLIVKMQSERDVGGSVIQHWRIDDIKKVVIPILTMDIQKEIADKVRKSFKLREKSNELLEAAKRAVEIAIEEDEETAMQYLTQFECIGKEV